MNYYKLILPAVVIFDDYNHKVTHAGYTTQNPALTVRLQTEPAITAFLLWNQQLILRTSFPVFDQKNCPFGSILTEQPLTTFTDTFSKFNLSAKTGDLMLCAPANKMKMDCFQHSNHDYEFKRLLSIMSNEPLPMHHALEGKRGIQLTKN